MNKTKFSLDLNSFSKNLFWKLKFNLYINFFSIKITHKIKVF